MGLFDMFGAGGGKVAIQPQSAHVSAGGALAGAVGFQGGSRAQQITNITIKLVMDQTTTQMTQQGPRQTSQTRDVVPAQQVTGPFTSTPGQVQQFPFNLMIPAGVPNTTPGAVKYRLVASADIDGEIDPGANVEIQVVGGAPVQAGMPGQMPGAMPGQMPGQMMPGMMAGAMHGQMGAMPGQMGAMPGQMPGQMPMAPAGPPQMGQQVMAQWQDGNWHPAVVVAMQNGMYGVDWVNPQLGQSSWVYPQQVQAQPPMAPPGMPMGMPGQPGMMPQPGMMQPGMPMQQGMPVQPGMSAPQASAMKAQMNAQHAAQPMHAKAHDPHAMQKGAAPQVAKGGFEPHKGAAAAPQKGGFEPHKGGGAPAGGVSMGMHVYAQWQDGNWHPGRVVAMQNGVIGVDWDDPKLGQSSWVQPHQVRGR